MRVTLKSLKERIDAMKDAGQKYRQALINRRVKPAFTCVPYEKIGTQSIPKTVNVSELMAIMLTAQQLGYTVELRPGRNGVNGNFERVDFVFVEKLPSIPPELLY